eukprot:GHVP01004912.1.p1 GENE.GHVP01004912.1~~GHVP01004912.1.p1  ORF type:complete len:467 (-),score=77.33 GHVP01004912.1:1388-2788(-)
MACSPVLKEDDLTRFRTKVCRRLKQGHCEFSKRCQYSHYLDSPRRCPFYLVDKMARPTLRYLPMLCPDLTIDKEDSYMAFSCPRGRICPYSHSEEEIMFHPLIYKTRECEKFASGLCSAYYCPFVHNFEIRKPKSFHPPISFASVAFRDHGVSKSLEVPDEFVPEIPGVLSKICENETSVSRNLEVTENRIYVLASPISEDFIVRGCLDCEIGTGVRYLGTDSSGALGRVELVSGSKVGQKGFVPLDNLLTSISGDSKSETEINSTLDRELDHSFLFGDEEQLPDLELPYFCRVEDDTYNEENVVPYPSYANEFFKDECQASCRDHYPNIEMPDFAFQENAAPQKAIDTLEAAGIYVMEALLRLSRDSPGKHNKVSALTKLYGLDKLCAELSYKVKELLHDNLNQNDIGRMDTTASGDFIPQRGIISSNSLSSTSLHWDENRNYENDNGSDPFNDWKDKLRNLFPL